VSGEGIPRDEPLFLLRARDGLAKYALKAYAEACRLAHCKESHQAGVQRRRGAFDQFAASFPERMKQPGITGDVRTRETMTLDELDQTLEELEEMGMIVAWPSREPRFSAARADPEEPARVNED
jgi:hypothetical protein